MGLITRGKIQKLRGVIDRDGEFRPAANADQQAQTNRRLGNFGNGEDGTISDDTSGSSLPMGGVPDGVDVVVQAQHENESRVRVGLTESPAVELVAGQSVTYRVENTDQIHIEAKSAGDGVNYSHEVSA